jgi:hypothetical protein
MVRLGEGRPYLWDQLTPKHLLGFSGSDLNAWLDSISLEWRDAANIRKFHREISMSREKNHYFISNWADNLSYVNVFLLENVNMNIITGEPMLPISGIVILLYFLYRRVSLQSVVLIGSFLLNINPLIVIILIFALNRRVSSSAAAATKLPSRRINKVPPIDMMSLATREHLSKDIGSGATFKLSLKYESNVRKLANDNSFECILLGNDLSTMYTAALLSLSGMRCCVLQLSDANLPSAAKVTICTSNHHVIHYCVIPSARCAAV